MHVNMETHRDWLGGAHSWGARAVFGDQPGAGPCYSLWVTQTAASGHMEDGLDMLR